jgi:hypothetical protein
MKRVIVALAIGILISRAQVYSDENIGIIVHIGTLSDYHEVCGIELIGDFGTFCGDY